MGQWINRYQEIIPFGEKPPFVQEIGDGSNVFDPTIEWDGYATDTVNDLGSHSALCDSWPRRTENQRILSQHNRNRYRIF